MPVGKLWEEILLTDAPIILAILLWLASSVVALYAI